MRNLLFLMCFLIAGLLMLSSCDSDQIKLDKTERNYGKQVDSLADVFNLPSEYLKALIVLECSGRKEIPSKYEAHVYKDLMAVKNGKLKKYHFVLPKHLKDKSNSEIKRMASSWGPFQLMGYKYIQLEIPLKDLYGEKSVYWGIKWINDEYGDYLRKKKFKDAFHIHNAGSPNKPTTDPDYAKNGAKFMDYFKNNPN